MWMVKRLKSMGANKEELKLAYIQQVRCVLEIAVPAWNSGLTISEKLDIERVQRSFCHIIYGKDYSSYSVALSSLGLDTLEIRRTMLCRTFAIKSSKDKKFNKWFKPNDNGKNTRIKKSKFKKVHTRTKRFNKSAIPYLTKLLNEEWKRKEHMPPDWKT